MSATLSILAQVAAAPASQPRPGNLDVAVWAQYVFWPIIALFFIGALVIYWRKFKTFKQNYAELSERIDRHIGNRSDGGPSPGHAYVVASRGPRHARDAESQSAQNRWRQLTTAFPHLADHGQEKRPLMLIRRKYTHVPAVDDMQQLVSSRASAHVRKNGRNVVSPTLVAQLGEDFDALRHPELAIANPAIYTFPFFLTWQRRHQWGVLPYGVHNRLGVICKPDHPEINALRGIQGQYGIALKQALDDKSALWVSDPKYAGWIPLLLKDISSGHGKRPAAMEKDKGPQLFSVGAYLHKELLPLACAVITDPNAGTAYAERAREIEVSELTGLLSDGPQSWPDRSAIIVDLAVLPDDLEQAGWEVLRLPHCVYVPIGIGYSVPAIPLLLEEENWCNVMLKDAGEILHPAALALAKIGIELDERIWTAS